MLWGDEALQTSKRCIGDGGEENRSNSQSTPKYKKVLCNRERKRYKQVKDVPETAERKIRTVPEVLSVVVGRRE